MIRTLTGKVTLATPPLFIVDVTGVGYELFSGTLRAKVGEKISCAVFTVVREDSFTLYGFNNEQERGLFALLVSVTGIGPKSALLIMSQLPPEKISQALAEADPKPFQSVKGIGKKVAERLVLELAGSVNREQPQSGESLSIASALENLGYHRREYQPLIKDLPEGNVEEQLTWVLKQLSTN